MQPEVNLAGVELAHGLEVQRGPAEERDHLVLVLGPGLQFLLPTGFKLLARPVGHFAPQPAGAVGKQLKLPRVVRRSRRIAQAWRVDLVGVLLQHHLLGVFQVDLPVDQVVLQALGPGLQMIQRRGERGGRALGLDAGRLEIEARRGSFWRPPRRRCGAGRVKKIESSSQLMWSQGPLG